MQRYSATPLSFLNLFFDLLEALLIVRFIFVLFSANAMNWLVKIVYGLTTPLVTPFRTIFSTTVADGLRVEWGTLIAMVIFAIAATVLMRVLEMIVTIVEDSEEEEYQRVHHRRHRHA